MRANMDEMLVCARSHGCNDSLCEEPWMAGKNRGLKRHGKLCV
jgi:hypothetical protein